MAHCAESNINPFQPSAEKPWDKRKALHLFRRATFGANLNAVNASLTQNPNVVVDKIVNDALLLPLTTAPLWANWTLSDYSADPNERNTQIGLQIIEWQSQWVVDMKKNGLRDKMSWFWGNHFVTKIDMYGCPSWMYRYHSLLQKHALGNFKTFVSEIGLTPAMLVFLNNIQNTRFQPNENYARELLELFTLGVDNGYTQVDITNVARAITGWNGIDQTNLCGDVTFIQPFWDPGQKTIFDKTGNWDYDDVINLLFTERAVQISEYICRKLYVDFVNPDVNEDMVKLLAKVFRDNNFEIAPVMKALLQSEHFFDDANVGTIIPGHIAYFLTFLNEIGYQEDKELLYAVGYSASEFNEQIFNPTDVAGWPSNRNWITTNSFPYRVEGILNIIRYNFNLNGDMLEEYRAFAKGLTMASESNPDKVCRAIVDYILPNGLQKESDYQDALAVFKAEIPENYFELGLWNLDWEYAPAQVVFLIVHLSNLPEFQLK